MEPEQEGECEQGEDEDRAGRSVAAGFKTAEDPFEELEALLRADYEVENQNQ